MAQRLSACDISDEVNQLARRIGGLTIWLCTHLDSDWVMDVDTREVWILNGPVSVWTIDLMTALVELADIYAVPFQAPYLPLHLVPQPRVGA